MNELGGVQVDLVVVVVQYVDWQVVFEYVQGCVYVVQWEQIVDVVVGDFCVELEDVWQIGLEGFCDLGQGVVVDFQLVVGLGIFFGLYWVLFEQVVGIEQQIMLCCYCQLVFFIGGQLCVVVQGYQVDCFVFFGQQQVVVGVVYLFGGVVEGEGVVWVFFYFQVYCVVLQFQVLLGVVEQWLCFVLCVQVQVVVVGQ